MGVVSLTDVEDFEEDLTDQLLNSMATMCAARPLDQSRIRKAVLERRPEVQDKSLNLDVGEGVSKSGHTVPETKKPNDAADDHLDHVCGGDEHSKSLGPQPHEDSTGSDDMATRERLRPQSPSNPQSMTEHDRIKGLEAKVAQMCDKFDVRVPRVMCCVKTCHVLCWTRSV